MSLDRSAGHCLINHSLFRQIIAKYSHFRLLYLKNNLMLISNVCIAIYINTLLQIFANCPTRQFFTFNISSLFYCDVHPKRPHTRINLSKPWVGFWSDDLTSMSNRTNEQLEHSAFSVPMGLGRSRSKIQNPRIFFLCENISCENLSLPGALLPRSHRFRQQL